MEQQAFDFTNRNFQFESSLNWMKTYAILNGILYAILAIVLTVAIFKCLKSVEYFFSSKTALLKEDLRAVKAKSRKPS